MNINDVVKNVEELKAAGPGSLIEGPDGTIWRKQEDCRWRKTSSRSSWPMLRYSEELHPADFQWRKIAITAARLDTMPSGTRIRYRPSGREYVRDTNQGGWFTDRAGPYNSTWFCHVSSERHILPAYELIPSIPNRGIQEETMMKVKDDRAESLDDYKQRVRKVAERLTAEYGWCDVVERALQELDIPKPKPMFKVGDSVRQNQLEEMPMYSHVRRNNGVEIVKAYAHQWVRQDGPGPVFEGDESFTVVYLPSEKA